MTEPKKIKFLYDLKTCHAEVNFLSKRVYLKGNPSLKTLDSIETLIWFLQDMRRVLYADQIIEVGVYVCVPNGAGTVVEINGDEIVVDMTVGKCKFDRSEVKRG